MKKQSRSEYQREKADADFLVLKAPADAVRISFYQLSTMLENGVNVVEALDILKDPSGNNPGLAIALNQVNQDLQSGITLSKSLTRFPRIFPKLIAELTSPSSDYIAFNEDGKTIITCKDGNGEGGVMLIDENGNETILVEETSTASFQEWENFNGLVAE